MRSTGSWIVSAGGDSNDHNAKMDDFVLVSVDDHLVEPPDMFERHIPDKFKDDVPNTDTVTVLDLAAMLPASS